MIATCYSLFLLLSTTGDPYLPGGSFRLRMPHQACVDILLPEVHPPGDPRPDLLGPADFQRLRKNVVGEEKGLLGVLPTANNLLTFCCQYCREAAPHCACGRGVPASQLRSYPAPTTIPYGFVCDSPVQMQPIVVVQVVSIDSL